MISVDMVGQIVKIVCSITILVCLIGIFIASKFQKKQKEKYQECLEIIHEKENGTFVPKNGLTEKEISVIDKDINFNSLVEELYNIYLRFINKVNINDKNFDDVLTSFIKDFYENKIDVYTSKEKFEIKENIELIEYSILEYSKEKLKFQMTIDCLSYEKCNNVIIDGSNTEVIKKKIIISYIKKDSNWLIENIENTY